MSNYQFTNKAVEDLSNVWNYTFDTWSKVRADKYYSELVDTCIETSAKHFMGRSYSRLNENLKGIKINRYIIFYRVLKEDLIEIERILHERMDTHWRITEK